MSHDPHVVTSPWRPPARSAMAKVVDRPAPLDPIRIARLAILLGLVTFWVAVVMLLF